MSDKISKAASTLGKLGGAACMAKLTPEQRIEMARAGGNASRDAQTPEQRSAAALKRNIARTKKRLAEMKIGEP